MVVDSGCFLLVVHHQATYLLLCAIQRRYVMLFLFVSGCLEQQVGFIICTNYEDEALAPVQ